MRNPIYPMGGAIPVMGVAPTELMPLITRQIEGAIAGIQQSKNFNPFTSGPHVANARQSVIPFGNGIEMGQLFNQPLTQTDGG